jgi:hypothetical protein
VKTAAYLTPLVSKMHTIGPPNPMLIFYVKPFLLFLGQVNITSSDYFIPVFKTGPGSLESLTKPRLINSIY